MNELWTTEYVPDGTWCWVYCGDELSIFLAKRDSMAAGGWTNEDCWEDFAGEVQCWIPITMPPAPPAGIRERERAG